MSLSFSSLPTLPDASTLPLPSVSEVGDAVSDVIVTAIDTAGEAANAVVKTARRQPKLAMGVGLAAAVLLFVMLLRRRHAETQRDTRDDHRPRVAAA